MNKKEKIKELMDLFKNFKLDEEAEYHGYGTAEIYGALYKALEGMGELDHDYLNNFDKIKGDGFNEKIVHLQELSFKECCTLLTAILRYDRFVEGLFYSVVKSGDVLKILTHIYNIL